MPRKGLSFIILGLFLVCAGIFYVFAEPERLTVANAQTQTIPDVIILAKEAKLGGTP